MKNNDPIKETLFSELDKVFLKLENHMSQASSSDNPCADCYVCCRKETSIPVSIFELDYIDSRLDNYDRASFISFLNRDRSSSFLCPNYDKLKKGCSIYKFRPLACRVYGHSPPSVASIVDPACYFFRRKNELWPETENYISEFTLLKKKYYTLFEDSLIPLTNADYTNMACFSVESGDFSKAAGYYEKAALLYSQVGDTRMEKSARAEICLLQGDLKGARDNYEESYRLMPSNITALVNLAVVEFRMQNTHKALELLTKVEQKLQIPIVYSVWGLCLARLEKYEEAILQYDKALVLSPGSIEILNYKAMSLEALEKCEECSNILDVILELSPDNLLACITKVCVLRKAGRIPETLNYYNRIFRVDPSMKNLFMEDYEKTLALCGEDPKKISEESFLKAVPYKNQIKEELKMTDEMELAGMPLIGDDSPKFRAVTTQGEINFPEDYRGKWVILFSHPADFTPVCTTEFMTFASMYEEFKALNTELIGLSIDSNTSHIAWLRTIKEKVKFRNMENVEVKFPVIEDLSMNVAKKFGMIQPNASSTRAVRAVFMIDPDAKIRLILYYPLTIGRNFAEIKRALLALQKVDSDSVATPADWQPGEDVIVPPPATAAEAQKRVDSPAEGTYCPDWFICFKKDKK